ncbi:alpha/beta fold hydrolase [Eggerthella lenta]|uniref:alpha/beta fold hydrolase n=1 Tax=Eggerthella lenta TaxID=84112 RepID=UPI001D06C666|nr:alpha/beta fold hydrolase [Eggerthella lenta]MCB6527362.1 alpha/beta fold hydrolase [Eggerthella lenta]MCG4876765.1 alpha/beta fold hydrolase [Eggerthella lenta]
MMLAAETRRFSFGGISFLYLLCQTPANGASASCPAPGAGFSSTTFSSCADHALNVCCPPATARPSAAPLILLHGFAQSSASWDAVARKLAATGRPIYALDLVGHGESERPADACAYALDAQGEALLSFARMVADREGARPAVLGYSMGGRVTLAALRRDPRAFAAVVLEAAGFGPATQAKRDAACATRLRADGLEAFMDFWEQLPLFASQRDLPPDVRERLRAGRMANDAEALARTFEQAGQHVMPSRAETLETLAVLRAGGTPLLYLAGERDEKYRALAAQAAEAGATVCIIPGAGHNAHLEAPATFAKEVASFLRK